MKIRKIITTYARVRQPRLAAPRPERVGLAARMRAAAKKGEGREDSQKR